MSEVIPSTDVSVAVKQVVTPEVKCPVCNLTYSDFAAYKRHVMVKHVISCKDKIKHTKQEKKAKRLDPVICNDCNLQFCSKYTLQKHINTGKCKGINTNGSSDSKQLPAQLIGVSPDIIRAVTEIVKTSLGITNTHSVSSSINSGNQNSNTVDNSGQIETLNNTTIGHQNNTQNLLQVNQDIKINPLGKENLDHITKEEKLEILRLGAGAVPALARAILELPENRNIAGYDKKNMKVMFVNRKGKIEIGNMDKVIGWFTEDNIGRVNNYITEYDDEFPPNNRLLHRLKVMQGHETIEGDDEEEHNRIYQSYFATCNSHVKDAIEVNSKSALQRLKKFRDLLEQQKTFGAILN